MRSENLPDWLPQSWSIQTEIESGDSDSTAERKDKVEVNYSHDYYCYFIFFKGWVSFDNGYCDNHDNDFSNKFKTILTNS